MRRRGVSAAGVIGGLALAVTLSGTTVAATGGTALLGRHNTANHATTLANPSGIALTLKAKAGTPPLSVHGNTTQIPSLNASLLDGLSPNSVRSHTSVFTEGARSVDVTVPAYAHHMLVTAIGGGGGGGSGANGPGGGGGQGGYAVAYAPVRPGDKLSGYVALGGGAGTGTADGGTGETTTLNFGSGLLTERVVAAAGGAGGGAGKMCAASAVGGAGGTPYPPRPLIAGDPPTASGVDARAGAAGAAGEWRAKFGNNAACHARHAVAGAGASPTFAGGGGAGGSGSTPSDPGRNGMLMIVWLR